jgi:hypothetical protein
MHSGLYCTFRVLSILFHWHSDTLCFFFHFAFARCLLSVLLWLRRLSRKRGVLSRTVTCTYYFALSIIVIYLLFPSHSPSPHAALVSATFRHLSHTLPHAALVRATSRHLSSTCAPFHISYYSLAHPFATSRTLRTILCFILIYLLGISPLPIIPIYLLP